jgi:hypothetical protein
MTYILGSRCKDEVVLIDDTKFTTDQGVIVFTYDDKLFAGICGVIIGFAGTRGKFELFHTAIMDYHTLSTSAAYETLTRCNKIVTRNEFLLKAYEISQKYKGFEILIGMTGSPSLLKHMYAPPHQNGGIQAINRHMVIWTASQWVGTG